MKLFTVDLPQTLLSYVPETTKVDAVDKALKDIDQVIVELRERLQELQSRMKKAYDSSRKDREFAIGDWVYLRLQPYHQTSLSWRKNLKLSPKFYGPFQITHRICAVAYKLDLPVGSRIHPVFHVSVLKQQVGSKIAIGSTLPDAYADDATLRPFPRAILDHRSKRGHSEVLVHWEGMSPAEATWEDVNQMQNRFAEYTFEDNGKITGGELLWA